MFTFQRHGITVEHYIVSTGLRQMIEGSPIRKHVDGVWGCELLSDPPGPGYLDRGTERDSLTGEITQVGYVLDNTTKTRAIFEINRASIMIRESMLTRGWRRMIAEFQSVT